MVPFPYPQVLALPKACGTLAQLRMLLGEGSGPASYQDKMCITHLFIKPGKGKGEKEQLDGNTLRLNNRDRICFVQHL